MSLLFERAAARFSPADADHLAADGDALAASESAIPLDGLAPLARNRPALAHPDREGWRCLPLHGADDAELTGEYVVYEDHPVRGDVLVYRDADGEPAALGLDEAATTALARRLRFWLAGHVPEERPSYAPDGPIGRIEPVNPVPEGERAGYFDRLTRFVEAERDDERERNRERADRYSPRQLREQGRTAVPEVSGVARPGDRQVRLHVPDGHGSVQGRFGVYEGDEVLAVATGGDPPPEFPVPATVERVVRDAVDLRLDESVDDPDAVVDFLDGSTDHVGLVGLLNPVSADREAAAVRAVRDDDYRRALLLGTRPATFDRAAGRTTAPRDADLNDEQAFAAAAALYADDVCCIHGPPGTGKTRVLVETVRRATAAGERVLVCADSNQAVDNLLVGASTPGGPDEGSLHAYAGEEFSLDRRHADHSGRELVRETYDHVPGPADVVATTANSAADLDADFDLAVFDEATQATIPSGLVPFSKADALVLAGDHKQLPPYEPDREPTGDERDRSLFEHFYADGGVYGTAAGVRLRTQYRMHDAIAAFPREAFYDGDLATGRDVPAVEGLPPVVGVQVAGEEREDAAHSHYNPAEADAARALVREVVDAGVEAADVGVVTPYRAQVDAVRDALGDGGLATGDDGVTVDTVDSFQGGEREAVVVSFVRSNDRGDVGFLGRRPDGPRRLNVALTRAGRFLGLVGDWETLRSPGDGNACADLYDALHDHVAAVGERRTASGTGEASGDG